MKNIITLLITLLISISSFAQQGINYKALIKDDLGNIVAGQPIGVQFQIRETAANGSAIYTETHTPTTDANGIMVLNIGTGNSSDTFSAIDWSSNNHWLNLQIDITGGTNYTDMSTTQFMAVPYALSAENVFSGNYNELSNRPNISGLRLITENNKSGWRLIGANPNHYGNIGSEAVDLSFSFVDSQLNGARGFSSVAMGEQTQAFGDWSTAMGLFNRATGPISTAMGQNTWAEGGSSTAAGINTIATNSGSFVVGKFNAIVPTGLFIVGKGSPGLPGNEDIRKNALVVFEDGSITAPSCSTIDIDNAGDKALVTKEYIETKVPIAYGTIESNANVLSGTGNFTATINAGVISISVNNENMSVNNTSCLITPYSTAFRTSSIVINGGDIEVRTFNSSGNSAPVTFQFVIYKL